MPSRPDRRPVSTGRGGGGRRGARAARSCRSVALDGSSTGLVVSPAACPSGAGSTPFRGTDGLCGSATFPFVSSGATSVSGMARRRRSRRIAVRRAVLLVGFVALLAFVSLTLLAGSPTRLPAGTTVGGLDVGGMELAQAANELEARSAALAHTSVAVRRRRTHVHGHRVATRRPPGLEGRGALGCERGRRGRADPRPEAHPGARSSATTSSHTSTSIRRRCATPSRRIAAAVDRPAVDAGLERNGLAIVTTAARPGVRLDRSQASAALVDALASLDRHGPVRLPVVRDEPRVTAARLSAGGCSRPRRRSRHRSR